MHVCQCLCTHKLVAFQHLTMCLRQYGCPLHVNAGAVSQPHLSAWDWLLCAARSHPLSASDLCANLRLTSSMHHSHFTCGLLSVLHYRGGSLHTGFVQNTPHTLTHSSFLTTQHTHTRTHTPEYMISSLAHYLLLSCFSLAQAKKKLLKEVV